MLQLWRFTKVVSTAALAALLVGGVMEMRAQTQPAVRLATYRSDAGRYTLSYPSTWQATQQNGGSLILKSEVAAYGIDFESFESFMTTAQRNDWNLHLGAYDTLTATNGNMFLKAERGYGSKYVKFMICPLMYASVAMQDWNFDSRMVKDRVWTAITPFAGSPSGTGSSTAAPGNAGGCPGCANAIMNSMQNMTNITNSGWK